MEIFPLLHPIPAIASDSEAVALTGQKLFFESFSLKTLKKNTALQ